MGTSRTYTRLRSTTAAVQGGPGAPSRPGMSGSGAVAAAAAASGAPHGKTQRRPCAARVGNATADARLLRAAAPLASLGTHAHVPAPSKRQP